MLQYIQPLKMSKQITYLGKLWTSDSLNQHTAPCGSLETQKAKQYGRLKSDYHYRNRVGYQESIQLQVAQGAIQWFGGTSVKQTNLMHIHCRMCQPEHSKRTYACPNPVQGQQHMELEQIKLLWLVW